MMTRLLLCICSLLLATGCATRPAALLPPPSADLLSDQRFKPPSEPVGADGLFTLSAPMKAYLHSKQFKAEVLYHGPERGLVNALYKKGELKIEYDATLTRTAAQTYAAGMGNCLSLVIMTAAFAREMGLVVNYQNVIVEEQWSRNGDIYFASTHVNLALGSRVRYARSDDPANRLVIDFIPSENAAAQHTLPLDENAIIAMYMNNRAAEAMMQGRVDDAYWWARAAIAQQPAFLTAYNTLGVVYQRHGDNAMAERVFRRALEREPEDRILLRNLLPVLQVQGKLADAAAVSRLLTSIEPTPPFHFFNLGMKAMQQEKFAEAKKLFAREVRRAPYNHEFHFWLAIAHWRLGDARAAREEMSKAIDTSVTTDSTQKYSAKLAFLRAHAPAASN
jgi:Flp pilus assembly protein TadD